MTATYQITSNEEFSGATVYIDGEAYTVSKDHDEWDKIVGHLLDEVDDDKALLNLIQPGAAIGDSLVQLSERVSYLGGTILFDGDPIESTLANHIVRIVKETGISDNSEWKPFVNFLEKLATNPSKKSRKHLFHFIDEQKITILPNGDFLAYKGVGNDNRSSHAGYGIVDGKVFENDRLLNLPGSVIEIPRSMVDDNRAVACSTGLHAGAYSYASNFASKLLRVAVNPRDVVSVPHDYDSAKLRIARYRVLGENDAEVTTPVYAGEDAFFDETEGDQDPVLTDEDLEGTEEGEGIEMPEEVRDALLGVVKPEAAPVNVYVNVTTPDDFQARTDRMVDVIKGLPKDTPLRKHRNKKITKKNREPFDAAVKKLGLSY